MKRVAAVLFGAFLASTWIHVAQASDINGISNRDVFSELSVENFLDRSPLGILTIAGDHHQCEQWPYTLALPLANSYRIPMTVYFSRGPHVCDGTQAGSSAGEVLSNSRLQQIAESKYVEIGLHGYVRAGSQSGEFPATDSIGHFTMGTTHNEGKVSTTGSATVRGVGTPFVAGDVGKLIYIPESRTTPFIVDTFVSVNEITVDPAAPASTDAWYMLHDDTYKTGTVSTSAGTPTLTGASTSWSAGGQISPPILGFGSGLGSIVVIEDASENPYYVISVNSATSITLNKNVSTNLSGRKYGIACWFNCLEDQVGKSIQELKADAGITSIVSFAESSNLTAQTTPRILAQFGIESETSVLPANGHGFNRIGEPFHGYISRGAASPGEFSLQGWKNLVQIVADSNAWHIVNTERWLAPTYRRGTAIGSSGSATITGSRVNWLTTPELAGCRSTPNNCRIYWKNDTSTRRHILNAIDDDDTITLTANLSAGVSGDYFIVEGDVGTSEFNKVCSAMMEWVFEWLDTRRDLVMVLNHRDALKRWLNLARDSGVPANQVINPKFVVIREDLLPPTSTTDTSSAIPPWLVDVVSNVTATTTLITEANGILRLTDDVAGSNVRIDMVQRIPLRDRGDVSWGIGLDPSGATAIASSFRSYLIVGSEMMGQSNPVLQGAFVVGDPKVYLLRNLSMPTAAYYKARVPCASGTCAALDMVVGPTLTSMSVTRNGAGDYTMNIPYTRHASPTIIVNSRTTQVACSSAGGSPTANRTATVLCNNVVTNVAADADFDLVQLDSAVEAFPEELRYVIRLDGRGTLKTFQPYFALAPTRRVL